MILRERIEGLIALIDEIEMHCPCGARPESPNTHAHVTGCQVAELKALAAALAAEGLGVPDIVYVTIERQGQKKRSKAHQDSD